MTFNFGRVFLAASLLSLAGPAASFADVTVTRTGSALTVTATGGSPDAEVSIRNSNPIDPSNAMPYVWVEGYGTLAVAGDCDELDGMAWCGTADLTSIEVDLTATDGGRIDLGPGLVPDGGPGQQVRVMGGAGATDVSVDGTYNVQFTGGAADDTANFGSGDDSFVGMGGDDLMRSSPGDDQFYAGSGNDTMETGEAPDGADLFVGDTERPYADGDRYTGDVVIYGDRAAGVTATLPPAASDSATSGNGEAGENDRLLNVESVVGGRGANVLHGNDADNELFGNSGNDVLTGGDGADFLLPSSGADDVKGEGGDDIIEARRDYSESASDPDMALDCGTGVDRIRRDVNDPAPVACEQDVPGFVSDTSAISGALNVGSVVTATKLETFADPGTTTTSWSSCATIEFDDCKDLTKGATYTVTPADLGRRLYAYSVVENASGYGDETSSGLSAPVGAALPVSTPTPPVVTPPVVTPPPFGTVAALAAEKALGAGAKVVNDLKLGSGVAAFTPKANRKGQLPVGKKPSPLLAVVCQSGCKVESKITVTLPGTKGKKTKSIKLKAQKTTTTPGTAGVITLKTTAAQRSAIKRSKNAKASVKVSVTQGGKKTTDKTTVKLVVKP